MSMTGLIERTLGSVPRTREARIISLTALINSTGTGAFAAGSAIYFTRFGGLTEVQLGIGLAVAGVIGAVSALFIGRLADRFGPRDMLLVTIVWRALGYLGYLFVYGFAQFLLAASLLFVMDRSGQPLNQALVGQLITGAERNQTMAFIRSLRNAGFTIGFGLAGIALATGSATAFRMLFIGNAITFFMVFFLVRQLPRVPMKRKQDADEAPESVRPPVRDGRFVLATAANGVLFLHDAILITVLPLWVANHTTAPIWMVTVLVITNTVITVMGQVRVAGHVVDARSATRANGASAAFLTVACAAFAVSGMLPDAWIAALALLAALLLLTAGELLHSASAWEISFAMAPAAAQGRYFAFFNLGFAAAEIGGPLFILWLLDRAGNGGWFLLAVAFPLAALVSWMGTRSIAPAPPPGSATAEGTAPAAAH